MTHYRQWSNDGRPTTSGTSVNGGDESQDHVDLAAALQSMKCYGTPKTGPVMLPADIPPVPALPAQFLGQRASFLSGTSLGFSGLQGSTSYERGRKEVDMEEASEEEDYDHRSSRARSDEEEDVDVFGMEV